MNKLLLISTRCVFVVTLVFVVRRRGDVLSDSMSLQLHGPHIHFNVHTPTRIYRQIYTHTSLVLFPSLIFIPASSLSPSRPEEDLLHHLFFPCTSASSELFISPSCHLTFICFPSLNPVCPRVSRSSSRSHLHPSKLVCLPGSSLTDDEGCRYIWMCRFLAVISAMCMLGPYLFPQFQLGPDGRNPSGVKRHKHTSTLFISEQ